MKKLLMILVVLACGWLLASCGGGGIGVTVIIDPTVTTIGTGDTEQFTAYSTAVLDGTITWSVTESGGGSITSSGLYTAPSTAGTYHVVATSNEDTTAKATAIVYVTSD